jgi:glycosyltransferase involved in cell wall biosynthesis
MATARAAHPPAAASARHRVLLLIDHLDVGGAQQHVALLAGELVRRGHEVHVLHTGPPEVALHRRVRVASVSRDRVVRREDDAFNRAVAAYAAKVRPTVIHAHLYAAALAGAAAAAEHGVPLVLSHHSAGTWQDDGDRARLVAAMKTASFHFAASPQIESHLIEQGVPPARLEFLPNAVTVPRHPAARQEGDRFRLGYLGRLDHDKDPVLALQALAHARLLGSRASLEMRGDGPLDEEVAAAVRRLDLADAVVRGGFVDDVQRFYGRIDALLLTSRSEGMPLVVLEAMGNELPVIATEVGALTVEVEHGVTGLLCDSGDAEALGEAIAWLEAHPDQGRQMGRRGRLRLERLFSVDRMTARICRAYDLAAGKGRSRARTRTRTRMAS